MNKTIRHHLIDLYEGVLKRSKVPQYSAWLQDSQWWTADKLREHQFEALTFLLRHAVNNVPYWKNVFMQKELLLSDIVSFDDFRKLPVTDKTVIRENYEQMISENWKGKTLRKSTGGSTGIPLHFEYTLDSYYWRTAVSRRGYGWAGCEPGRKIMYLWSVPVGGESFILKQKAALHDAFLGRKMFNLFKLDNHLMDECVNYINSERPEGIVGYTTALYTLGKFIKDSGVKVQPVKSVITAAEQLFPFQRELIAEVFGAQVFNSYGCREFMLIACECSAHEGLHLNSENLFVELLKDGFPVKAGEVGEVVITDLHNYGMPFIRYRTGDLAVQSAQTCSCGRGLPLIESIEGRTLDMIRASDGRFISGVFFPHLMKELKGIERFQVVQDSIGQLQVKVVKNHLFSLDEYNFLQSEIAKVMGVGTKVDYLFVDSIPLNSTGKFRVTISKIK